MRDFLLRLRQRKLVQWALAYVAFAFALLQGLDVIAQRFAWPERIEQVLILALAFGLCIALLLAWYHGERGAQRVSGVELLLLGGLLAIGGGLLWHFDQPASAVRDAPTLAARDGAQTPPAVTAAAPAAPAKSIAVLPFVNMSGDAANEYFSDGITEEILNALAQVPGLKVAARTSAFAFKGKEEDLRKVGEVLDVATVLEGSVQRAGDQVRITAQLIDTRSGYHLWSERYDRMLTNIFAVEDEISRVIAGKLQVQLDGDAARALVTQKTVDPRAHDAYLRGLGLMGARSVTDAAGAFQQAVALDPAYAQAWGALAQAQVLLPQYTSDAVPDAQSRAETTARRALTLDPDTALAQVALGMVYSNRWQWSEADQAFRRALALAPGNSEAVDQYAQFLLASGQFEPALHAIEQAQASDPVSGIIGVVRASILNDLHRQDEAVSQMARIVEAHPRMMLAHQFDTLLALDTGNYAEAEKQTRLAAGLRGDDPEDAALLVRGMADPALRDEAVHALETGAAYAGMRRDAIVHAMFLARLGARDPALGVLERYADQRDSTNPQLLWDAMFDSVRDDPRFKAVLKKLGLPYVSAGMAAGQDGPPTRG